MKKETYEKHVARQAKQFRLDDQDLHNLFDLFFMIDYGTLRANKMDKWAGNFFDKLEEIILWDVNKVTKKNEKN